MANFHPMMDSKLLDLYSARLKDLCSQVKDDRPLSVADASVTRRSPLCGSQVTFDVRVDGEGNVAAVGFVVRACSLTEAASAIAIKSALGSSLDELVMVRDALKRMLRGHGDDLPGGKWADLDVLKPAQMVPTRHGSALLPFKTLVEVVEKAQKACNSVDS